jgi:hypothetical protein
MDCNAHLMAANELINIREMSKRSSVPAATLRYYEKLGLITSERETSGSHRRYSEATLHRITYITLAGCFFKSDLDAPLIECGDQSGRTSAPIMPHSVQTIRPQRERTGVSSASQSAFMVLL